MIWLGGRDGAAQARLDGFKWRVLRSGAPAQRHLYATEWRSLEARPAEVDRSCTLMLGGEGLKLSLCAHLSPAPPHGALASPLAAAAWSVVFLAEAPRGCHALRPLVALELALELVQAQAGGAAAPSVWLLTAGAQLAHGMAPAPHAGAWGLARSAREEARLPLGCVDVQLSLEHRPRC